MPKRTKCIPCMSEDVKNIIRDNTRDLVLIEAVNEIPTCPLPGEVNFCLIKKRAPSKYQEFMKSCLATKPLKGQPFGAAGKFMKECASEWRKRKGSGSK